MDSALPRERPYRGRFAPSPSGPLHFGSLIAALASYLQAKSRHGQWLVRIEDLDPPREQPGASDAILRTLDAFGLHWDEPVLYQSLRHDRYRAALAQLSAQGLLYRCQCNRLRLQQLSQGYDRHCLLQPPTTEPCAWRVLHRDPIDRYLDGLLGEVLIPAHEQDDFIVQRKDGQYAYQLAVVVDDAESRITEVVRGSDLLLATGRQLYLYRQLQQRAPDFVHVPVVELGGRKLSKQNQAPALDSAQAPRLLQQALRFLNQPEVDRDRPEIMLRQASQQWQVASIPRCQSLSLTDSD